MHTWRSSLPPWLVTLLLFGGASAAAQQAPAFVVERITVEGVTGEAARRIVVSESQLREGGTYTEGALRDAVYRVKRLPFVVDADMALGKGSERGAYELVITVEMAKPIAFSIDAVVYGSQPSSSSDSRFDSNIEGTVTARRFVGSKGLLFGSVQGFDVSGAGEVLQLGYSRYDLFRRGGYATVGLSTRVNDSSAADDLQGSLQLGIPLVGNHALRANLSWTQSRSRFAVPEGSVSQRFEAWQSSLEWIYDSTDDPLIPTDGARASITAVYQSQDRTAGSALPGYDFEDRLDSRQLLAEGRRYWPLTPRQSFAVGGAALFTDTDGSGGIASRSHERNLEVDAIHAVSLWDFSTSRRYGDLRMETSVGLQSFHESDALGGPGFSEKQTSLLVRGALLFRNAWGLIRLAFVYVDSLGDG